MSESVEERQAAKRAILHLRLAPVMFEQMGALSIGPQRAYLEGVASCDILVIILVETVSPAVNEEYRQAARLRKPILAYLEQAFKPSKADEDLYRLIGKDQKYHRYSSISELEDRVILDILNELTRGFRSARSPITIPSGYSHLHPQIGKIIEFTRDGIPNAVIPLRSLNAVDILRLFLYVAPSDGILMAELSMWLSRSWHRKSTGYITGLISSKREHVIKEGQPGSYRYRLSQPGKEWVENVLIPKLIGNQ